MRGAKELHGRRVMILFDATMKGGAVFRYGDEGTFRNTGVVRCTFRTDDGRVVEVGRKRRGRRSSLS